MPASALPPLARAEITMARRRRARLVVITLAAIVFAPVAAVILLARIAADRGR